VTSEVLLVGCGDLGAAVGLRLAALGHDVLALRRNADLVPAPLVGRSVDLSREAPDLSDVRPGLVVVAPDGGGPTVAPNGGGPAIAPRPGGKGPA
jgi:NAD(P)-dependent dehydrogenase (short-subunit alcohol dehydrogenase family)